MRTYNRTLVSARFFSHCCNKFKSEYSKVVNGQIKPFELMKQLNMKKSTYYKYDKRFKEEL
ncbi:hypothetical protein [Clostridium tagluense]|uniref:hypothetical protein n=1 Tax=Clostridium tagluense TaxID=360422 RepID=UPI001C6EEC3B|nr:hypothetical protein [Clostridium tagluense]MBW9155526.1 hypothetical protein [Clostridium tagluense]WLC66151.1 hypothetical protein KTC93_02635 [Clostridium tagluense]